MIMLLPDGTIPTRYERRAIVVIAALTPLLGALLVALGLG